MRRVAVGLLGSLALAGAPVSASAEADPSLAQDSRWLPWIGCWEGAAEGGTDDPERFVVCFRFLDDAGGVEILTYTAGELVAAEEMRADGRAALVEEGGCEGERTATWSADGARVFLTSEMSCGEGVTRTTRGLLSILPEGQGWIEVHSVRAGASDPLVGIRSFVPASTQLLSAYGIPDPADGRALAVSTARAQAGGRLTSDALVELVERAGPVAANALIVERGEPFELDASTLRSLARRGVPSEVIDVMVAVTYPGRFEVAGTAQPEARPTASAPARTTAERASAPWPPSTRARASLGYSPWGFGYYDPFWGDPYFHGYGAYGFGFGSSVYRPFGSAYYNYPRVIVVQPPVVQDRGPRVSRTEGYLGDTPQRNAVPASNQPSPSASPAPGARTSSPPSTSTPTPQSTRSPPPSTSSGGSDSGGSAEPQVRRAVPRP